MKKNIIIIFVLLFTIILSFKFFNNKYIKFALPNEEIQGSEDDPYAASRFRWEMITGGRTDIDPLQLRQKAIEQTKNELQKNSTLQKENAISWLAVGPGNIGGRIRSIIINPSNSNEMLIGSVGGGIWKTTNGGTTWIPKLDTQDPLAIGSMVLVGSSTVYAGTGEGWWNIDAVYGGGIYKSTDFGNSWTLLSGTIGGNIWNFRNVLRMTSDPSGNVYAVTKAYNYTGGVGGYYTNGGLYRTTNGGTSWSKISTTSITNYYSGTDVIAISSSIILFSTDSDGIYRTTDSGTNWTKITSVLPTSNFNRIAMTQDPNISSIIYAVFSASTTASPYYGLRGIYKSTDSGVSWSALSTPPRLTSTGNLSYLSAQGWYDNVIAVDPFNSSNLYVGGVELMKSTNGGSSWSQLTYWHSFYGSPVVHADHHAIVFDPNNSGRLFGGNDGGIFKTTNNGTSWSMLNNNLEITQFYGGAVYPTGTTYYGGAQDNGHLKYSSGTNWTEVESGDGGYAAQDQTNSSISYEEYVYLDMEKSTNGGVSWSSCTSGLSDAANGNYCLFISPFSINPENSNVLIAGSDNVWITSNSAATWTASSNILSASNKVSAVTVVNSAANYLGFAGTTDGKVFKCTSLNPASGIDTWTEITPAGNNAAWVRRIVVDLSNKNKIYVCYSGFNNAANGKHVWMSTNQGSSWSDISTGLPDIPVHSLVIDPVNANTLYLGTETGVYQTTNSGSTWTSSNSGMPSYVPVDELVLQTGTNILFAFTHGRGVWQSSVPLPVELSSFTASVLKNGNVELKWRTETEFNNYGFEIERANVNQQFQKIGFEAGHGNSNATNEYSFTDNSARYGKYSYRLKQIDNNGQFKYSDAVEVNAGEIPNGFVLEQNYPNPFNPSTIIRYYLPYKSRINLKVYDLSGREVASLVNETEEEGEHEVKFTNNGELSSGVYFYTLNTKSFTETKKFILMK